MTEKNNRPILSIEFLELLPLAAAIFNQDLKLILANRKFGLIFGAGQNELADFGYRQFLPAFNAERLAGLVSRLNKTSRAAEFSWPATIGRPEEKFKTPVNLTIKIGRPSSGGASLIAVFVEELSEGRVEDITSNSKIQLALTAAKEAAESANKAKNEFLANISHELRTPLNIIIGMTGLVLESSDLGPEAEEYLNMVKGAGEDLLAQVNDLIAVGDLGADRLKPNEGPFTAQSMLNLAVLAIQDEAREKDVEVKIESTIDDDIILLGDHRLINMALSKVTQNAVKFSSHGRVKIVISLEKEASAPHNTLIITVADSGVGLPKEGMEKLFGDFTQGDSSNTRNFGGLGVGLYLARGLARLLSGNLSARNLEEGGAEFTLEIPVGKFSE